MDLISTSQSPTRLGTGPFRPTPHVLPALQLCSGSSRLSQAAFFAFPSAFALLSPPFSDPWAELGAKVISLPSLCSAQRRHSILYDILTSRPCQCPLGSPLRTPHLAPHSTDNWRAAPASGIDRLSHQTVSSTRTGAVSVFPHRKPQPSAQVLARSSSSTCVSSA